MVARLEREHGRDASVDQSPSPCLFKEVHAAAVGVLACRAEPRVRDVPVEVAVARVREVPSRIAERNLSTAGAMRRRLLVG